jgi:hypothetical protein
MAPSSTRFARCTRLALVAAAVLAAVGTAGCPKPSMGPFDVTPHVTCPRSTVTVSWTAAEDVVLYQQSPFPPDKGVLCPNPPPEARKQVLPARSGTMPATVERDTRFTLCFTKADQTISRVVDVRVVDGSPIKMGGVAACSGGELRTSITPSTEQGAAALPVAAVTNHTARPIIVEHEGVTEPVAPDAQTTLFKGKAYAGEWVIHSTLAAGETCDQALDAIASRLRVEFLFDCGGK